MFVIYLKLEAHIDRDYPILPTSNLIHGSDSGKLFVVVVVVFGFKSWWIGFVLTFDKY